MWHLPDLCLFRYNFFLSYINRALVPVATEGFLSTVFHGLTSFSLIAEHLGFRCMGASADANLLGIACSLLRALLLKGSESEWLPLPAGRVRPSFGSTRQTSVRLM